MPEPDDLDLLMHAAQLAGAEAKTHVGTELDVTDKPDNAGPVTAADLAVNALLCDVLRSARPDYGWLSEESTDDPDRLNREFTFIIDPIDGTRSFIAGSNTWSHSLAIARGGQIVAAVVHLPMRDMTNAATLGGGARLNGAAFQASAQTRALSGAHILTTRPNLDAQHWAGSPPEFRRAHRPSLAYRLALVGSGRFDGMFTFRPSWEWDIAAGALICSEAGVQVGDKNGAALKFNNSHPQTDGVIAAPKDLFADIMRHRAL